MGADAAHERTEARESGRASPPGSDWNRCCINCASRGAKGDTLFPGLRGELRPYQKAGVHWLRFLAKLGLGACLADDMGLGKTVQVIALLLHLQNGSKGQRAIPACWWFRPR